jgi:hypothetical protein
MTNEHDTRSGPVSIKRRLLFQNANKRFAVGVDNGNLGAGIHERREEEGGEKGGDSKLLFIGEFM